MLRPLLQRAEDDSVEDGGHRAAQAGPRRGHLEVLAGELGGIAGLEREAAGEHAVEQHAERIDVGAGVDLGAEDLLGGHDRGRADEAAGGGEAGRADLRRRQLGDAEIEELDPAGRTGLDGDVARLDVAVDDPGGVRGPERGAERLEDLERLLQREALAGREQGVERGAAEELHGVERAPVLERADIEDLNDPGVVEQVDDLDLAHEPLHHPRRHRQHVVEDLHRSRVKRDAVMGAVDGAAAAFGEVGVYHVVARAIPGRSCPRGKGSSAITTGSSGIAGVPLLR